MNESAILPRFTGASHESQSQSNPLERILVVEDDGDLRRLNAQALSLSGYEVETAVDGAAAWAELQTNSYDLMITDNNMPKVTGVELLVKLRAARMELPVIMASGTSFSDDASRSPWLKPAARLLKPYTFEELIHLVKKVLREADPTPALSGITAIRELSHEKFLPAAELGRSARPRPVTSAHRILVVDGDQDLRQLYVEALAIPGYQVDMAADGAAAWQTLQSSQYHLLITEHDLPKLNGLELVRRLRAAHMALPVVLAATRLPNFALGSDPTLQLAATLMKPFPVHTLLDTVRTVLHATDAPGVAMPSLPARTLPPGNLRFG